MQVWFWLVQVWFRFGLGFAFGVQNGFRSGRGLGQVWFRFGSGLVQDWSRFAADFVQVWFSSSDFVQ